VHPAKPALEIVLAQMVWSIHFLALDTRAYTPGKLALAHPGNKQKGPQQGIGRGEEGVREERTHQKLEQGALVKRRTVTPAHDTNK
jgi:hypothetical protein